MPFTQYADGTIVFAAQLNADNATSLDLNTATSQTIQGPIAVSGGITTAAMTVQGTASYGGATVNNIKTINAGVTYSVIAGDRYIFCQTGAGITISLPSSPAPGRTITIKDAGGTASPSASIVIIPASGNIDGGTSYTISAPYGTVTLIYSGARWLSGA